MQIKITWTSVGFTMLIVWIFCSNYVNMQERIKLERRIDYLEDHIEMRESVDRVLFPK